MLDPYIGITDFETQEQAWEMLTILVEEGSTHVPKRKLGVGVMMSYKTLHGLETRWSEVFPPKESIVRIFPAHKDAFNVLHYADYQGLDVVNSLTEAARWGGPDLDAIQLDMIWPSPAAIQLFKRTRPALKLILQIGAAAFEQIDNDAEELLVALARYGDILDGVLLDKSMGQGRQLSVDFLRPFLSELSQKRPDLGLVVAGGLGPKTLDFVEPLVDEFPQISIDAQGRLRPSGNAMDPIDWSMAADYLRQAMKMFWC